METGGHKGTPLRIAIANGGHSGMETGGHKGTPLRIAIANGGHSGMEAGGHKGTPLRARGISDIKDLFELLDI